MLFAAFEDVEKFMKFLFSEARFLVSSASSLCAAEQRRLRQGARMPGSPEPSLGAYATGIHFSYEGLDVRVWGLCGS